LRVERELEKALEREGGRERFLRGRERGRLARTDALLPQRPLHAAVRVFEGAKEREVVEPGRLLFAEVAEGARARGVLLKRGDRRRIEQAVLRQIVQAHQQRVAGEGRLRAVRRLAVARRTERERLPPPLRRRCQEVDERARLVAEVAAPVRPREARRVQENAARALPQGGDRHRVRRPRVS
jgi:hypothetical protein